MSIQNPVSTPILVTLVTFIMNILNNGLFIYSFFSSFVSVNQFDLVQYYTHTHTHTNTYARTHARTHARMHTHTHAHARARAQTHTHTHTHLQCEGHCLDILLSFGSSAHDGDDDDQNEDDDNASPDGDDNVPMQSPDERGVVCRTEKETDRDRQTEVINKVV